jgi:hypothetical protein
MRGGAPSLTVPLLTLNHDATVFTSIASGGCVYLWDFFKRVALPATDFKTLRAIAMAELVHGEGQMTGLTANSLGLLRQQQQMMMLACIHDEEWRPPLKMGVCRRLTPRLRVEHQSSA